MLFPSHMGSSFGVVRAPVRPSVDIDYEILSTDILLLWVVVSNKRKNVHEVLLACQGKSRVRRNDRLDINKAYNIKPNKKNDAVLV